MNKSWIDNFPYWYLIISVETIQLISQAIIGSVVTDQSCQPCSFHVHIQRVARNADFNDKLVLRHIAVVPVKDDQTMDE